LSTERVVGPRTLERLIGEQVLEALARTSVRAAALSATFILVNRAALELDVDPEEFDVIEPRMFRPSGGFAVPVLQFVEPSRERSRLLRCARKTRSSEGYASRRFPDGFVPEGHRRVPAQRVFAWGSRGRLRASLLPLSAALPKPAVPWAPGLAIGVDLSSRSG